MDQERDQDQPGDLSALAWVNDELRRTLDNVHKTLRRHLRDVEGRDAGDPAAVSTTALLQARGLYHQGVGALELIGLDEPSRFLAACEQAVQRLALGGVPFNADAVSTLERASFGLLDYLRRLLSSKPVSALALFPQYKAVLALAGADRVHPADLWSVKPVIADDRPDDGTHPLPPTQMRQKIEGALLEFFRSGNLAEATGLSALFQSLVNHAEGRLATLWPMAAAFFEAQGAGLLPIDVYTKRMASRLLTQLRRAEAGQTDCPDRLLQDLLFFCARAQSESELSPLLAEVRRVHGIKSVGAIDYEQSPLGRFDPALIPVARRRVANLKESWSALASGEMATLSGVVEQGGLVIDSIRQLYPDGDRLARSLQHAFERASAGSAAPGPELAMEVATTLLCLEASLDDGDLDQPQLQERVSRLADRLDTVASGLPPQPLEPWVEDLYRQVSDRQAMGSVVQELRSSLAEIEQQLDRYSRNAGDVESLRPVPGQLSAMRGVLAVLGLDHATQAIHRMRDDISHLLTGGVAAAEVPALVADNLGAMSFLIDMLGVQPQLARTLFRFDPSTGEFAPVMGQIRKAAPVLPVPATPAADAIREPSLDPALALPDVSAELVPAAAEFAAALTASSAPGGQPQTTEQPAVRGVVVLSADDQEMRDIFLEEAREVVEQVGEHLAQLSRSPEDHATLTAIRRGFHTLKGSSRMVGLRAFGEAAWSGEQLFNARLADSELRADAALLRFSADAITEFAAWIEEVAELGHDEGRDASHLIRRAQALRLGEAEPAMAPVVAPVVQQAVSIIVEPPMQVAATTSGVVQGEAIDADFVHTRPVDFDLEVQEAVEDAVPIVSEWLIEAAELPSLDWVDAPAPAAEISLPAETLGAAVLDVPAGLDIVPDADVDASGVPPEWENLDFPLLVDAPDAAVSLNVVAAPLPPEAEDGLSELAFDLPLERDTVIEPEAIEVLPAEASPEIDFDFGGAVSVDQPAPPVLDVELNPTPIQVSDSADEFEAHAVSVDVGWVAEEAIGATPEEVSEAVLVPTEAALEASVPLPIEPTIPEVIEGVEAPSLIVCEAWPVQGDDPTVLPMVEDEWEAVELSEADTTPWDQVEVVDPVAPVKLAGAEVLNLAGAGDAPGAVSSPWIEPEPASTSAEQFAPASDDEDGYKLVGTLRIPIALFNIYLNEADEQSRRLGTALAEWQLEFYRPVAEAPIALAHSLAGNSATVGHRELSALARRLEHALEHSRARGAGNAEDAALFADAAEEIRRLLHQFAAGFLKSVSEELLRRFDVHEAQNAEHITHAADLDMPEGFEQLDFPLDEALPPPAAMPPEAEQALVPVVESVATEEPVALLHTPELPVLEVTAPVQAVVENPAVVLAQPVRPAARTGRRSDVGGFDEGLDAVDVIDPELFEIFDEEGQELLPTLAQHLRDWEADPERLAAGVAAMRALHTFKGGARLAGAMRLGELAHRLETAIEHVTARGDVPDATVLAQLQNGVDALDEEFQRVRLGDAGPADATAFDAVQREVDSKESPYVAPESFLLPTAWAPLAPVALSERLDAAEPALTVPELVPAAPSSAVELVSAVAAAAIGGDTELAPGLNNVGAGSGAEPVPVALVQAAAPQVVVPAGAVDWSRFMRVRPTEIAAVAAGVDGTNASVRVRAQLLDRLVSHAGEVGIARARIESDMSQMQTALRELTDNLERLRRQLRDLELQAETQMTNRIEAARHAHTTFDPLEMDRFTRVQELTRMMAESVNDVGTVQRGLQQTLQSTDDQLAAQARLTRDLQDDLLRARMVEFDTLSDRLYRVVRQAAKESNKQVRLNLEGGGIELDRAVLDRMAQAFEHLLRNAVVHGIESPARREAAHKPAIGTVEVRLQQMGNEVQIEVRDDGAGLNLARIAERARLQGLLAPGASVSEAELAGMIFRPGFTTVEQVTELAGRGVGMDVVRAEVTAMGGRIETATTSGQGTAFRMVLPLTTAVTQVVVVSAGEVTFAVPSTLIELVKRVPAAEAEAAYLAGSLMHGQQSVPFFWAGGLLQHGVRGAIEGRTAQVLVVRSAAQYVALHVDQVQGNQEVVVKNLGPQLSRLPGLAGISVLASGNTVLIYNPVALAAVYGGQIRLQAASASPASAPHPVASAVPETEVSAVRELPLVMVIDDSLTVRRVTQRLLQREGYRVLLAKDGLEALELLQIHRPAVMLCDIEMPRMDGFDLVRNVRGDARLADIPVIMITSRIAQKHQEHARALGVDHYLGKPYDEERLLELVRSYAEAGAVA